MTRPVTKSVSRIPVAQRALEPCYRVVLAQEARVSGSGPLNLTK